MNIYLKKLPLEFRKNHFPQLYFSIVITIFLLLLTGSYSHAANNKSTDNVSTNEVAITGVISSPSEGPMEGVIVSAKGKDSTITVSERRTKESLILLSR